MSVALHQRRRDLQIQLHLLLRHHSRIVHGSKLFCVEMPNGGRGARCEVTSSLCLPFQHFASSARHVLKAKRAERSWSSEQNSRSVSDPQHGEARSAAQLSLLVRRLDQQQCHHFDRTRELNTESESKQYQVGPLRFACSSTFLIGSAAHGGATCSTHNVQDNC